jgi:hypothetical protein
MKIALLFELINACFTEVRVRERLFDARLAFYLSENLLSAPLDPVHYMILLGPKYDPNMNREPVVEL